MPRISLILIYVFFTAISQDVLSLSDSVICPKHPVNPEVVANYLYNVLGGSFATFRCSSSSAKIVGSSFSVCLERAWSHPQPSCRETSICGPPVDRSGIFTLRYSNERRINSTVTFHCKDNQKRIEGKSSLTCLPNGTWSGHYPKCVGREVQPFVTTPNQKVSRFVDVESLMLQDSDAQSNQKCTCIYDYENSFLKTRLRHRTLKQGDAIMPGETVSFECRYPSMVLIWENGLRFFGRANMTCSSCEKWQSHDLPTCKLDRRVDAVIGQEDELAVLPGGTVLVQKGESRRFFCSYFRRTVQWTKGLKEVASVTKTQDIRDRKTVYVSYLDITHAEDSHSGIYECYTRRPGLQHIWSSFLHLKVVEITATPPVYGVFPDVRTYLEIPDDASSRECFCVYDSEDSFATAQVGNKKLKRGDIIMDGETVSFECETTRSLLSWQNNVRYKGNARMTCSKCKVWSGADLPTCSFSSRNEAFITSLKELTFLPGAIVYMKKGESNEFRCVGVKPQTKWKYEAKVGITERKSRLRERPTTYFISHLEIQYARREHSGIYECTSGNSGSTTMYLQVDDSVSCPKHPIYPGVRVRYSDDVSVGSVATFSCSSSSRKLTGSSSSVCLERGTWSRPAPSCEDSVSCPKHPVNPEVRVTYSDDVSVGSVATFICSSSSRKLIGSSSSVCLERGTWSHPAPTCGDSVSCPRPSINPGVRVTYSDDVSVGSVATFSCLSSSRKLIGSSLSVCLERGTWSHPEPSCEDFVSCPRHPVNPKVQVTYSDDVYVGSVATFSCLSSSIKLIGSSLSVCLERGTWSHPQPSCGDFVSCTKHPVNPKMRVTYSDDVSVGSVATFSCSSSSMKFIGSSSSVCLEIGTWSSPAPSCEDTNCPVSDLEISLPEDIELDWDNMDKNMEEFLPPGSEMGLKCVESAIDGVSKALCGEDGRWKLGTFHCVPACFLNIDPSSELQVHPMKESYRTGDIVFFSCPPSKELSPKSERVMCMSGSWSSGLPECLEDI